MSASTDSAMSMQMEQPGDRHGILAPLVSAAEVGDNKES